MALPKIMIPHFSVKLPSDDREITFRPFLVKEEKALLMAVESGDQNSVIQAIKDALIACVDDVDISKLPYFDVEFLFLNLRAKSIGEEVKLTYRHREGVNLKGERCDASSELVVRVDKIGVKRNDDHQIKFMIDDILGIKMIYPTINNIKALAADEKDEMNLMASCIEFVYDADNVYPPDSIQETIGFIEQMNASQYEKLSAFFETMPKLYHEESYVCSGCGQEDTVKFEGISDFF